MFLPMPKKVFSFVHHRTNFTVLLDGRVACDTGIGTSWVRAGKDNNAPADFELEYMKQYELTHRPEHPCEVF